MATFQSRYAFFLAVDQDQLAVLEATEVFMFSVTSSGDFSIGETITVTGDNYEQDVEYIGYTGNGWIGQNSGSYFLLTNDQTIPQTPFGYSAEPFTVCFSPGTRIHTPAGEIAVENLAIGDLVMTTSGRAAPVRWIGVQTVSSAFADPLRSHPIRIMAGALGEGLPTRDLCVSPDHALLVDGVLVQAGALVNGTTITRMTDLPERFTYFHVELEDHALILAEGVPAETFVDNVTRRRFDNYAEFEALYGETAPTIAEMETPRVKSSRQVPAAIRRRLQERAAALVGTPTATAA